MRNTKDKPFEEVLKELACMESNKDRFLEAARLARHEEQSRRLNGEQKFMIIMTLIGVAAVLGLFFILTR